MALGPNSKIVPVTPAISQRASALIDATDIEIQATLLTANVQHLSAIEGLQIEVVELEFWGSR